MFCEIIKKTSPLQITCKGLVWLMQMHYLVQKKDSIIEVLHIMQNVIEMEHSILLMVINIIMLTMHFHLIQNII